MTHLRAVTVHVVVITSKDTHELKAELGEDESVDELVERVRADLEATLDAIL